MAVTYKDRECTIKAICPLSFAQPIETGADYHCTTDCAWCIMEEWPRNVAQCAVAACVSSAAPPMYLQEDHHKYDDTEDLVCGGAAPQGDLVGLVTAYGTLHAALRADQEANKCAMIRVGLDKLMCNRCGATVSGLREDPTKCMACKRTVTDIVDGAGIW